MKKVLISLLLISSFLLIAACNFGTGETTDTAAVTKTPVSTGKAADTEAHSEAATDSKTDEVTENSTEDGSEKITEKITEEVTEEAPETEAKPAEYNFVLRKMKNYGYEGNLFSVSEYNERGDIVKETYYYYGEILSGHTEYAYDENGILSNKYDYDENGELTESTAYMYYYPDGESNEFTSVGISFDRKGDKTKEETTTIVFDEFGQEKRHIYSEQYYELDEEIGGYAVIYSYSNAFTFEYDEKGRVTKETPDGDGNIITYKYTTDRIIEIVETYSDSGKVFRREVYSYDGDTLSYTTAYNEDGNVVSVTKFEYNEIGLNTKLTYYDADGNVDGWYEYEYDYYEIGEGVG